MDGEGFYGAVIFYIRKLKDTHTLIGTGSGENGIS